MQLKPVALLCTSEEPTTGNSKALVAERKTKGHGCWLGLGTGKGGDGKTGREKFDGDVFIFGSIDVIAIKLCLIFNDVRQRCSRQANHLAPRTHLQLGR